MVLAYDPSLGLWMKEDNAKAAAMANLEGELYLLYEDHTMEQTAPSQKERVEWMAEFAPFDETLHNKKGYTFLRLRLDMSEGAWVKVEVREDRGPWVLVWTQSSTRDMTINVPLRIGRCDRFGVRLTGKGRTELRSMVREFTVGSEG